MNLAILTWLLVTCPGDIYSQTSELNGVRIAKQLGTYYDKKNGNTCSLFIDVKTWKDSIGLAKGYVGASIKYLTEFKNYVTGNYESEELFQNLFKYDNEYYTILTKSKVESVKDCHYANSFPVHPTSTSDFENYKKLIFNFNELKHPDGNGAITHILYLLEPVHFDRKGENKTLIKYVQNDEFLSLGPSASAKTSHRNFALYEVSSGNLLFQDITTEMVTGRICKFNEPYLVKYRNFATKIIESKLNEFENLKLQLNVLEANLDKYVKSLSQRSYTSADTKTSINPKVDLSGPIGLQNDRTFGDISGQKFNAIMDSLTDGVQSIQSALPQYISPTDIANMVQGYFNSYCKDSLNSMQYNVNDFNSAQIYAMNSEQPMFVYYDTTNEVISLMKIFYRPKTSDEIHLYHVEFLPFPYSNGYAIVDQAKVNIVTNKDFSVCLFTDQLNIACKPSKVCPIRSKEIDKCCVALIMKNALHDVAKYCTAKMYTVHKHWLVPFTQSNQKMIAVITTKMNTLKTKCPSPLREEVTNFNVDKPSIIQSKCKIEFGHQTIDAKLHGYAGETEIKPISDSYDYTKLASIQINQQGNLSLIVEALELSTFVKTLNENPWLAYTTFIGMIVLFALINMFLVHCCARRALKTVRRRKTDVSKTLFPLQNTGSAPATAPPSYL